MFCARSLFFISSAKLSTLEKVTGYLIYSFFVALDTLRSSVKFLAPSFHRILYRPLIDVCISDAASGSTKIVMSALLLVTSVSGTVSMFISDTRLIGALLWVVRRVLITLLRRHLSRLKTLNRQELIRLPIIAQIILCKSHSSKWKQETKEP